MKKIVKFTLITLLSVFVLSCSISEETVFNQDGSIDYSCMVDGSRLMKMMPDTAFQKKDMEKSVDTVFSFADFIEKHKDSIAQLPPAEQEKLEKIKPLSMRSHIDTDKKELFFQIFGKFADANTLNYAFDNSQTMQENIPSNDGFANKAGNLINSLGKNRINIEWDGKIFRKTVTAKKNDSDSLKSNNDSLKMAMNILFNGQFKSTYKFPKKVKSVSDSTALLSRDKKTVTVSYDLEEYLASPERANIKIELENK